ncbi:peptidase E [Paenibacillus sp. FSL H7-0326]|uniref:Type 1 glutamine amidotransferase-like domain-containing protein n=1 Tax=Paenibacillus sp. FSL H7-0326 TaxID=1921144 RepID=UPI00096EE0D6|nr:peptidase E [Paenibacillus sp. FSL H7-0326]OMC67269.1 peptidase E [Paenibacillus sp. FSL H7-0326]
MKQIIAMGGGGFSMEPDNLLLDKYILEQAGTASPKVCFIPTASGDADNYVERFYHAFSTLNCTPVHLSLFRPNFQDLESYVLDQDIVYVGGGSTRNMLVLWKEWGLDRILHSAYEKGVILAGLSAGSICWFEDGLTDPLNASVYKLNGLGLLEGSHCPHYDGEVNRRPGYHKLISEGAMKPGYGVDDGAALHFADDVLLRTVSSRIGAKSHYVSINDQQEVDEQALNVVFLGERV